MMKTAILAALLVVLNLPCVGQVDITYYLPDNMTFNPSIPTPKSVIGHEVGEWHISHDRLVNYMYALAEASDRVNLEVTGYTHEARPLLLLTITSPKNYQNIEKIRTDHVQLSDPSKSSAVNTGSMPLVFYMGFSIHGNEPSGSNASLLVAYYLAAAQGPEIETYLDNTVILFDPSFNPDGLHRFSSWVNSRRSKVISPDPADMEHNEPWPGGRTNHYWFDLNRDWMVAQQPESQARIKQFQRWKPNVLTDHHEMGTNATFFFQPGVPARVHPLTPDRNQELTRQIGTFHAAALDSIGSFYYTQEGYDDFYYGKGSTFPDVQGAIGILFEQASSRGHAQSSDNGVLRFPFTIRNQFTTALSTLKAVNAMRVSLLDYQRDFYKNASSEASKDPVKAIVFGSKDHTRAQYLAEVLARQDIAVYKSLSAQSIEGTSYEGGTSYVLPMNQLQYRLIKGMFEKRTTFKDSLFYDISSWTLPLAFGVDYAESRSIPGMGQKVVESEVKKGTIVGGQSRYAYAFEPYAYYTPRAIYRLLKHNIRITVANQPFNHPNGKRFERGSIVIPVSGQEHVGDQQLFYYLNEIAEKDGIDIHAFETGLDYKGTSLGSRSFDAVRKPKIAMLVGDGVSYTDVGEIWHLLDFRMEMPVTCLPVDDFNRADLDDYNTLIMAGNSYQINEASRERLKTWVRNGGVILGFENAVNWLNGASIGKFEMKKNNTQESSPARPYQYIDEDRGAQQTSGAIFEAQVDLTHPLLYGYYKRTMPIFKGNNLFMEKSPNSYGNPIVFGVSPLMSGYISKQNYARLKNSSVVNVSSMGSGRVIGFTENLAFRAFWLGTNKLLTNAIFYGANISSASTR